MMVTIMPAASRIGRIPKATQAKITQNSRLKATANTEFTMKARPTALVMVTLFQRQPRPAGCGLVPLPGLSED